GGGRPAREGRGCRARRARRPVVASLLPCPAAGGEAGLVRPLLHARERAQELARVGRMVRRARRRRALEPAPAPPARVRLPDPEAARPPPGGPRGPGPNGG